MVCSLEVDILKDLHWKLVLLWVANHCKLYQVQQHNDDGELERRSNKLFIKVSNTLINICYLLGMPVFITITSTMGVTIVYYDAFDDNWGTISTTICPIPSPMELVCAAGTVLFGVW
jgi:hypothetical protein